MLFFLKKFHLKVFSLYNIPAHGGLSFIGKGFFMQIFFICLESLMKWQGWVI